MRKLLPVLLLSVFCISCGKEETAIKLPSLFQDNMVVQRDRPLVVWGEANPDAEFTIRTSWGSIAEVQSDTTGHWEAVLEGVEAGGPHSITFGRGADKITIDNVLSGEVWLGSGQSNMEMPVRGWPPNDTINYSAREIAAADFPDIRMFTVQRTIAAAETSDVIGSWEVCSPENVGGFSATAYFFARELYKELGVPIGIIHSSWGGTPAEAWVSSKGLEAVGDFDESLARLREADAMKEEADAWLAGLEKSNVDRLDLPDVNLTDAAMKEVSFDDNAWKTIELPAFWEQNGLAAFDGIVWFRKSFEFTGDPGKALELRMGAIDDMDITYINGIEVGRTVDDGMWSEERTYTVPAGTLVPGRNVIAVKVFDGAGGGGIHTGEMSVGDVILAGDWKYHPVAEYRNGTLLDYGENGIAFSKRPESYGMLDQNAPAVLFNGMIAPIIKYAVRGVIWYQGESNVGRADQYMTLFPALIQDWRRLAGENFPFYFVQIAPYTYGVDDGIASAQLRDAQRKSLSLENTGMVVTMDIGNVRNIHPSNKQDVGKRLAHLALAKTYKIPGIEASGPLPVSAEATDNGILISFSNADSGLVLREGGRFELAGPDGQFYPAQGSIEGEDLILVSRQVPAPVKARYAYVNVTSAYLFNGSGLPASSFEIDIQP